MKFNKNKRIFLAMYTAMMSAVMLTGFASSTEAQEQSVAEAEVSTEAAEQEETLDDTRFAEGTGTDWGVSQEVIDVQSGMIENVKIAAAEAKIAYEAKLEEERRAAEEAERIAREKAEAEAAAAAQAEAAAAQQAEKELHQVEEKLGFVASGYMSSWDRREAQKQYMEETGEKLFANMEEERESTESTLLDSFIKRMKSESDDDYGWLEPNGTFHTVEFGMHENWAANHVAEFYGDEHEEKQQEARKYISYGDFLTDRGWVLLHNPSQGIAIPTTSPGKRYTKAQKE